jgi:hypothetical protein
LQIVVEDYQLRIYTYIIPSYLGGLAHGMPNILFIYLFFDFMLRLLILKSSIVKLF